jgi:tetratricopeptide (TPR) repeat protein
MMIRATVISCCIIGALAGPARAGEMPVRIDLTDSGGTKVSVPDDRRATVMLFVLAGQPQTGQAIEALKGALASSADGVRAVVIVNGARAAAEVGQLTEAKVPWPIVQDADHVTAGKLSVHVWPTTVIVSREGVRAGHVAGLPKGYASDVEAYVAFAAGAIDPAALAKRLASHEAVGDTPEQIAERHVQVARRLLAKGLAEQARGELGRALALEPKEPATRLAIADLLLGVGDLDTARRMLDRVGDGVAVPQVKLLRARLLIADGKWDDARAMLLDALKLNPDPAETYYQLGLLYEHDGDPGRAAWAFRKAYESCPAGRASAVR